jgi:transcriptional antiterminator NusG
MRIYGYWRRDGAGAAGAPETAYAVPMIEDDEMFGGAVEGAAESVAAAGLEPVLRAGFEGGLEAGLDGEVGFEGETEPLPPIDPDIKWYVIHTYSGYENKVKANIEKVIEIRGMQELILDIVVPMEEQIEIKDGRKKVTLRKVFPGYVLIKMLITDDTWYVVRNTRGVTGFVGPGSKPVPLSDEEVKAMGVEEFAPLVDYEVGDNVRVATGPLENFVGIVEDINMEKKKVRVLVSMFGRETPVELELVQIQKL